MGGLRPGWFALRAERSRSVSRDVFTSAFRAWGASRSLKHSSSMPRQVASMAISKTGDAQRPVEAEHHSGVAVPVVTT